MVDYLVTEEFCNQRMSDAEDQENHKNCSKTYYEEHKISQIRE